jgi:Protein of unknown function (DUF2844)
MKNRTSLLFATLAFSVFSLFAPPSVFAMLGAPATSIASDALRMNASGGASPAHPIPGLPAEGVAASGLFSIQQLTTPAGTVVSQYVGRNGLIFAVTWRGARTPDLATLLGRYFRQYSDAAKTAVPGTMGLHVSNLRAGDVVVQTAGHMGFMWGRAYLPAATPAGVNLSEIQ